jgi:RNA polymerase sigma-70 factor (ECF subfamily)
MTDNGVVRGTGGEPVADVPAGVPVNKWQLERYLPLLNILARRLWRDPRLRVRCSPSELVQDTYVNALEALPTFHGQCEAELVKWLRVILTRLLIDRYDYEHAEKRDVDREEEIRRCVEESSYHLFEHAAKNQASPSEDAVRREQLRQLAAALEQLPEDWREAVTLKDVWGDSKAEIARQMERSEKAVDGLLLRGRRRLRELLGNAQ